jgi:hypothetical protein
MSSWAELFLHFIVPTISHHLMAIDFHSVEFCYCFASWC